jgi:hypothetical protein
VATAIGLDVLAIVLARAHDHVEVVLHQQIDHLGQSGQVVGRIAIDHDVDVGLHVREHAAHHIALAAQPHAGDPCAGGAGHGCGVVGRGVVEDVHLGLRQVRAEGVDHLPDGQGFVVAGDDRGDTHGWEMT